MTHPDPATERAVREFLKRISGKFDVERAILYGSRARGTHREDSDADLAIILRGEPQRFLPTVLAMSDTAFDVFYETGIDISPLPVWSREWQHPEEYPNPELLRNIAIEGVSL